MFEATIVNLVHLYSLATQKYLAVAREDCWLLGIELAITILICVHINWVSDILAGARSAVSVTVETKPRIKPRCIGETFLGIN